MSTRAAASRRTAANRSRRSAPDGQRAGRPRVPRAEAIARITRFVAISEKKAVRMADLCKASGVSERTLRAIFVEVFGMSPKRYLRARKLHAIRAQLSTASPGIETVTSIARRLGVKDTGRMARDYYACFGEYPRKTLERRVAARGDRA
jgi:AraC family transcriptional regulator, ethanolamine operon transcriptional activator